MPLGGAPSSPSTAQASATGAALLGATVIMTGTVRTNKDFGASYSYALIVEDAKVVTK